MPRAKGLPLFAAGQSIEAARVRLSPASAGDIESMPWLAQALEPLWDLDDLNARVAAGQAATISKAGKPIGVVVALVGQPLPGAACVPFIAIEPAERFRGLGGEAALGLERWLAKRDGVDRLLAAIPDQIGLAVYFWLRLGYRPLRQTEAPWPLVGLNLKPARGIWMARETRL
jgi:antitoxin (DNA-binding transcriptional repressor) of toxin-antitoxin stability system